MGSASAARKETRRDKTLAYGGRRNGRCACRDRAGTVEFYTDWLWFGETGYQHVFVQIVASQAALGAVATVLAFGVLLINMRVAMRDFSPRQLVFTTREGPIAIAFDAARARAVSTSWPPCVALLFGLYASSQWLEWLLFLHAQPFGETDPHPGQGRELLRVSVAVPGHGPRVSADAGGCSRAWPPRPCTSWPAR